MAHGRQGGSVRGTPQVLVVLIQMRLVAHALIKVFDFLRHDDCGSAAFG
jgi:hypothetical protein